MTKSVIEIVRRILVVIAVVFGITFTGFGETVTNVRGSQRPNSKLVDIYYDLNDADGGTYYVEVEVVGRTNDVNASSFSGDVGDGVSPGQNRHIVWDAGTDWSGNKGDVQAVVTAIKGGKPNKVQLWAGGPYWADRNIGAVKPWESGLYFWWGDIIGCKRVGDAWMAGNSSSSHGSFAGDNTPTFNQKTTAILQSDGWITADFFLTPRRDAAHVQWGGSWRMPTHQELKALSSNCDWTWTTINGVSGYIIRGRGNYISNSIFFPCTGYGYKTSLEHPETGLYWSSVAQNPSSYSAKLWIALELRFNLGWHGTTNAQCYEGKPIRPVQ